MFSSTSTGSTTAGTTATTGGAAAFSLALRVERAAFTLDVALELPCGGVTAFFGASGSGKTTLLRAIAGLEPTTTGVLRVNGETWLDTATGRRLPAHRRRLGYVFQEPSLFPHFNVRRNIEYGRRRQRADSDAAAPSLDELCALLGIGHLLDRPPATLSGGERQRAAIARALFATPRMLLMDEPLASLDQRRKDEFMPYLERLRDTLRIPILYVSHAAAEVRRLAARVVMLEGGRVTGVGGPDTLAT